MNTPEIFTLLVFVGAVICFLRLWLRHRRAERARRRAQTHSNAYRGPGAGIDQANRIREGGRGDAGLTGR